MRLLGCFKVVPDLELLTEQDWDTVENHVVTTEFVRRIWNCFDESVLELLLRAKDSTEDSVYTAALTVGSEQYDMFCKTLYAVGFDRVTKIGFDREGMFLPDKTAQIISEYIKKGDINCAVFGMQSSDENNNKIGYLTSEVLGWPCISEVMGFWPEQGKNMKVVYTQFDKRITCSVKLPCVLIVGNVPGTYLRIPTLKERLRLGNKTVEIVTEETLLPDGHEGGYEPKLTMMERVKRRRSAMPLYGRNAGEVAKTLYLQYIRTEGKDI